MSRDDIEIELDGHRLRLPAVGLETVAAALGRRREEMEPAEPCGEGVCGACSLLVDGELVAACITPLRQLEGCRLTTFDGLLAEGASEEPDVAAPQVGTPPRAALREAARRLAGFADRVGLFPCDRCRDGVLLAAAVDLAAATVGETGGALDSRVCRCSDLAELVYEVRSLREDLA